MRADCICGRRPRHSFEELPSVEDADAVEKHDQAGQADRSGDLCLRRECADGEADEQDGADAKRKAADVDLADQVTDADGEKRRKNRLGPDDVAGKIEHDNVSARNRTLTCGLPDQRAWQPAARNCSMHAIDQVGRRRRRIGVLVVELHRLPFEGTELMERLHLDPLDVLHRRDKFGDAFDIGGIVGEARHQREAHPRRLADRREALGEAQGRRQIAAGHRAIGVGIRAFDVEQNEIEARTDMNRRRDRRESPRSRSPCAGPSSWRRRISAS